MNPHRVYFPFLEKKIYFLWSSLSHAREAPHIKRSSEIFPLFEIKRL